MSDDRSIIYVRVAPERIADVNWIMARCAGTHCRRKLDYGRLRASGACNYRRPG